MHQAAISGLVARLVDTPQNNFRVFEKTVRYDIIGRRFEPLYPLLSGEMLTKDHTNEASWQVLACGLYRHVEQQSPALAGALSAEADAWSGVTRNSNAASSSAGVPVTGELSRAPALARGLVSLVSRVLAQGTHVIEALHRVQRDTAGCAGRQGYEAFVRMLKIAESRVRARTAMRCSGVGSGPSLSSLSDSPKLLGKAVGVAVSRCIVRHASRCSAQGTHQDACLDPDADVETLLEMETILFPDTVFPDQRSSDRSDSFSGFK